MKKNKCLWILPALLVVPVGFISASCVKQGEKKIDYKKQFIEENKVTAEEIKELEEKYYVNFDKFDKQDIKGAINDLNDLREKEKINIEAQKQSAELIKDINGFYDENYAKLLNEDLKNYYLLYKNNIVNEINKGLERFLEIGNKLSYGLDALKDNTSRYIEDFKSDKWLVFDKKDAVSADELVLDENVRKEYSDYFTGDTHAIQNEKVILATYSGYNRIDAKDAIYENLNYSPKLEQIRQYANKEFPKLIDVLKNILPTIINKNWTIEQKIKALAKYVIIKNHYPDEEGYDDKGNAIPYQLTMWSLKDKISQFNCQGYTSFINLSLNLLGYNKTLIPYGAANYYENDEDDDNLNDEFVPHINNQLIYKNETYVIDVTYADRWEIEDKDDIHKFYGLNKKINSRVLIPLKTYLTTFNYNYRVYNSEHQLEKVINTN